MPESPPVDRAFIDQTVDQLGRSSEAVIPILQRIQGEYRYLPPEALQRVCEITDITPAAITGVASFYSQFRHTPMGEHVIHICRGTACHVKGAGQVQQAFADFLGIAGGSDTSSDGKFTIEPVACLGCCTLAPVVQIDGITYGRLTTAKVADVIDDFLHKPHHEVATVAAAQRHGDAVAAGTRAALGEIRIGMGSCCVAQGAGEVRTRIEQVLAQTGAPACVKRVGCVGMCHQTPLLEVAPPRPAAEKNGGAGKNGNDAAFQTQLYANVQAADVESLVLKHFRPHGWWRRLTYRTGRWVDRIVAPDAEEPSLRHGIDVRDEPVCAFLGPQQHIATEHCGHLDPTDIDEYRRHQGFAALKKVEQEDWPGQRVIDEITAAGLRGRGGAGFPSGRKWQLVHDTAAPQKYVICNGDEGDPGAFMDRMILESFPYRVIEGMAIAARAVGADRGIFYIRAEYPLAVKRIREAIERCAQTGLVQGFALSVMEGAGAFVCGEETALLASLEGRRGTPRLRPPYPAESGFHGAPTLISNVETFANVPWIIRKGAGAFASIGSDQSKGTKVFALAGKVARGGLIEVPMGMTLRQIVEEIGGGVAHGKSLKAVQVGGPSGGCVPAELLDTPVDFEALVQAGAIMGSGGLVVLDETDCMVDIARYFLRFTQDQSCGKCTFCRIGTRRMLDILDRICTGSGRESDLELLEELAHDVKVGSLCGLGKTAPNPVVSTLRHFRQEYEAHLAGHCPAGACKDLIEYSVNHRCIGCTLCAQRCPADAIAFTPYQTHQIDNSKCTRCDACREVCPENAVEVF